MSSRYAAARPKRAGEQFARTHHAEDGPSKKPKFDVRNPSALAPDAPEEDAVLDADVIGALGAAPKRGAVNIDGYDSDSENEGFDKRAEERARGKKGKGDVTLEKAFEYDKETAGMDVDEEEEEEEDDDDIFGEGKDDDEGAEEEIPGGKGKKKAVSFLNDDEIVGQVESSKSGGHISSNFALDPKGRLSTHALDDQQSSDDEEEAILAAQEEDIDDEVGAGGLKRNAPKVDAFNMKAEQEEGRFDEAGNFVRKANDPDAKHDSWLEGVSKKDMKKAAEAHEKRELELRHKRLADDAMLLPEILRTLILRLEKGETVLEALARLGKGQTKTKKIPKWKLKKQPGGMDVDTSADKPTEDPVQIKIKEAVDEITNSANQLLTRGQTEIYEQEREMLIRQYRRESGEDWVEPPGEETAEESNGSVVKLWEYRWIDGRDGAAKQGPYDGATMVAWQDAGYFGEGVEFRKAGDAGTWSRIVDFV